MFVEIILLCATIDCTRIGGFFSLPSSQLFEDCRMSSIEGKATNRIIPSTINSFLKKEDMELSWNVETEKNL